MILYFTLAITVRISKSPETIIPVANPAGMSLLKIIAWTDREPGRRRKDALDLAYLFETYERIPTITDRIYEGSELESYDYDNTLAGAHILGLHAAALAAPETKEYIRSFFEGRLPGFSKEKLVQEMCNRLELQLERNEGLLDAFCNGYLQD